MNGATALPELANLLASIQKLYPQARVTSGYRGPDNPLTQAHPGSMHAQGSPEDPGAVDVAPIPGVTFQQYVDSVKGAGVPVGQAYDEQKHPFPWTTGPNWHLAQGQAPVAAASNRKPRSLGDVMPGPDLTSPAPVDGAPMASMPVQNLGDLAGGMPQADVPDHKGLFPGKDWRTFASIALGAIGDGLLNANGMQPIAAPMMRDRMQREFEEKQGRERLAAQIAAERAKAQEPPQFIQNLQAWMQMTPEMQQQYLTYQDAANPIAISGPQGTQRVPRELAGGGTKVVNGTTYHNINGQWFEEIN